MSKSRLFCLLMLLGAAVACGGETPPPAPEANPTTAIVVEELQPTAVPITPTTQPTIQPTMPPPVQATAVPTVTPPPATAVPDAILLQTAEDFAAAGRNPLTGEIMADPSKLERRPLAIKISNAPPNYVRPQSGLNQADILFEHITEAVVTRFTGVFYGDDPETVGPIRSARLVDVELPAMYDAALGYSGSSNGVANRLFSSDFSGRILRPGAQGYYRTGDDSKPFEHTFYAYPDQLRGALGERNRAPQFGQQMSFSDVPPDGGQSATTIAINYKWETVEWRYDEATNRYFRWAGGVPHVDANTGEQVNFRNVVIPYANHVNADICEQISAEGECQLLSVEIQLWGEGRVTVFRDGQMYEGTWRREGRNDMLTFHDGSGNQIPLQIGNTWVQLMSIYYDNPVSVEP